MPIDLKPREKGKVKRSKFWGIALPVLMVLLGLVAHALKPASSPDPAQIAYLQTGIAPLR